MRYKQKEKKNVVPGIIKKNFSLSIWWLPNRPPSNQYHNLRFKKFMSNSFISSLKLYLISSHSFHSHPELRSLSLVVEAKFM